MKPALLLTEGRFGDAVAAVVRRTFAGAVVHRLSDVGAPLADLVHGVPFVAVATWRLYDRHCEALDDACRTSRVRWSGSFLLESNLWIGPLVVPGHPPCWRCFRERYLTHHAAPERELALVEEYERNRDLGPAGFVPAMAWIAAAALVRDAQAPETDAGRVTRIDLCTGAPLDTRVLGVHACPRCRPSDAPRVDRFVRHLAPRIKELLP
jgi:bacteriocin biosynthesis cyclodehydratase domain-containing protein